jgi:ElaB/YqjD/DUF883 family membrane-anchored ribosome-binding protein
MTEQNTNVQQLETQVQTFNENYSKFSDGGVKAAGTRARKALAEISKLCKEIRKQIQEQKNAG